MTETQTKTERRGMRDMRTAVTARIRSKPTTEGQRYLDLYVLQRDRVRWRQLRNQAEKSIQSIDYALRQLGFNPDAVAENVAADAGAATGQGRVTRTINLGMTSKRKRVA